MMTIDNFYLFLLIIIFTSEAELNILNVTIAYMIGFD